MNTERKLIIGLTPGSCDEYEYVFKYYLEQLGHEVEIGSSYCRYADYIEGDLSDDDIVAGEPDLLWQAFCDSDLARDFDDFLESLEEADDYSNRELFELFKKDRDLEKYLDSVEQADILERNACYESEAE